MSKHKPITLDKVNQVIKLVAEGVTTTEALKIVHMDRTTLHEVIEGNPSLQASYSRAHVISNETRVEDLVAIAENPTIDPQRAKNIIEVRKWIASKINPRKYGDKIEVNVNQSVDISLALKQSIERVLSVTHENTTNQITAPITDPSDDKDHVNKDSDNE